MMILLLLSLVLEPATSPTKRALVDDLACKMEVKEKKEKEKKEKEKEKENSTRAKRAKQGFVKDIKAHYPPSKPALQKRRTKKKPQEEGPKWDINVEPPTSAWTQFSDKILLLT